MSLNTVICGAKMSSLSLAQSAIKQLLHNQQQQKRNVPTLGIQMKMYSVTFGKKLKMNLINSHHLQTQPQQEQLTQDPALRGQPKPPLQYHILTVHIRILMMEF